MLTFSMFDQHPVIHGFTNRHGGYSKGQWTSNNFGFSVNDSIEDVMKNYYEQLKSMSLSDKYICMCHQVHGKSVKVLDEKIEFKQKFTSFEAYDGMITNRKDLVLVTYHADCVPIFFYAPKEGVIGLAHAGWKGTKEKIVQVMLKKFYRLYKVAAKDVRVVIGPAADSCCYEVDQVVMDAFDEKYYVNKSDDGHCKISLKAINLDLLLDMGVRRKHVEVANECTICDEQFFSHRREKGKTGRMIAIFSLTSS